jgi:hypothetical protein
MRRKNPTSQKSAQRNSTARNRKARRSQRTAAGHLLPTDWECPRCSQWFSSRRNGPNNHLRFCFKHPPSKVKGSYANSSPLPTIPNKDATDKEGSMSSNSDSDSSEMSDSSSEESSSKLTGRRHGRRVSGMDHEAHNGA